MVTELRAYLARLNRWSRQSVNHRIFAAAVVVGGFTLLTKVAALIKDLVVANQFGTSDTLDAFLIAYLLPSFAINLIAGSFNAAFIPTYIQIREREGPRAAQRLFSNVVVCSTVLLLGVSLLLALLAPYLLPLMGISFSQEKLALTRSLFLVLLPMLVITGLATIWTGILNAGQRFALAAMVPMVTPTVTFLLLLLVGKTWGGYALAVGTVGGLTLEATLLAWSLQRHGVSLVPRWYGMDVATKQVLHQYAPMIAGAFLLGSTPLVDQSIAASLGSGSVAALNYGNKIVVLLLNIGTMALGTAVLPHFSEMVAVGNWTGVRHTLTTYTRLIVIVTLPLTLGLMYFSEPLIRLLFERGEFRVSDSTLVGHIQTLYLLQVPFFTLAILRVRLISSLRANRVLMWGAAISFFLNILLDLIFMRWWGVAGIALSTSTVYFVSFCYLLFMSLRLLKKVEDEYRLG
ncbi:polysaccharide biosynthesis C-terminal domain-containing protein [Candidatus Acetothermia bacterium]|nr:polysaccharide biosynthesis C-terminal domain-containing protein [Candidatus Acetothermia bacterium]